MLAVVDTSALFACADADAREHLACLQVLSDPRLEWIVPAMAVAEASYLIGQRLGPRAEVAFLNSLAQVQVEAPLPDEWKRIAEVADRYSNLPIGGTDASIVVLAERLNTNVVVTLDRRHFEVVRWKGRRSFRILP